MADDTATLTEFKEKGTLSPGVVNRAVVERMIEEIPIDDVCLKIRALLDMTRVSGGKVVPDARAMEAGLKLWFAYVVGMPTQRQEVVQVNLNADAMTGLRARLESSPAMREAFQNLLNEIASDTAKPAAIPV